MPPWNGGSSGMRGERYRGEQRLDRREARPGRTGRPVAAPTNSRRGDPHHQRDAGSADEREAPPPLGVLDRLEQEARVSARRPASRRPTPASRGRRAPRATPARRCAERARRSRARRPRGRRRPSPVRRRRGWRRRTPKKQLRSPVWHAPGPPARRRTAARRRRSRSRPRAPTDGHPTSRPCSSTPAAPAPEPRAPVASVRRSASSFIQPSMSTWVPCSCTIAATSPFASYWTERARRAWPRWGWRRAGFRPCWRSSVAAASPDGSVEIARFCQTPAVTASTRAHEATPRAPAVELRHTAGRAGRSLVLAATATTPRGAQLPGGRERLHRAVLSRHPPLRERIYEEILGRVQETDVSPAHGPGWYEYFLRTIEGAQYDVHCRRPRKPGLPDPSRRGTPPGEDVVLDENVLAAGHDYFAVGDLAVSPEQRWARALGRHDGRRAPRAPLPGPHDRHRRRRRRRRRLPTASRKGTTSAPSSTRDPTRACARGSVAPHARHAGRHDVLVFQEDDDRFFVWSRASAPAAL